jgi:hypothetical protein
MSRNAKINTLRRQGEARAAADASQTDRLSQDDNAATPAP